jgi:glutathione synthase
MYDWQKVEPKLDSTIRLIHEAATRGHRVSIIHSNEMAIRRTIVWSTCHILTNINIPEDIAEFYHEATFKKELLALKDHDALFLRDNPPLDNHLLNFLDTVEEDVFIVNSISGLRKANNKIYPATLASLHDDDIADKRLIPLTTVSRNREYLKERIEAYENDRFIMKPMDGFGGSGVILLDKSSNNSKHNINSLIDFYINAGKGNNFIILQEFIETDLPGDIRVIMLNGKPIGSMRRVPAKDDHRSNVHAGGHCVMHKLNDKEIRICKVLGPTLVEDGLYLAGIDLMGGKLIEVNVCSPGGLVEINEGENINTQGMIIDFVEKSVKESNK